MPGYTVVRTAVVPADPATVHALVNDFHQWRVWSPWEDLDPDLQRTYSGPDRGVGARYAWKGNRKAGEGSMEITASEPEHIDVRLAFLKPFSATNDVRFTLTPTDAGTTVEWRMDGEQKGFWGFVGRFMNMDKLVGKDFEKGLARLQAAVQP
ncbi:transcriptional regulator [Nocardioides sp. MAH-18]|uniref:Transcriptional regulator n=1 Tax=Nocardioides agri TaxID=2682843 RepID=A0A6L6XP33_9ACTN|nr:SRPBCC family protein [Nocardioides sp. CGMCC 1.13656]MBA2953643.1 SRPBCC family protein [Nocardioides sp. CGMCC 1.13656]MVQ48507.1 transcriptional regulator [Nocardioides sp. MAH-18]